MLFDILQAFFDEALEGHYDDVKWDGDDLVVTDIMGDEVGRIQPQSSSFVDDFKNDADSLIERRKCDSQNCWWSLRFLSK